MASLVRTSTPDAAGRPRACTTTPGSRIPGTGATHFASARCGSSFASIHESSHTRRTCAAVCSSCRYSSEDPIRVVTTACGVPGNSTPLAVSCGPTSRSTAITACLSRLTTTQPA